LCKPDYKRKKLTGKNEASDDDPIPMMNISKLARQTSASFKKTNSFNSLLR